MSLAKPRGLKPGDRVRLIAPASPFDLDLFEAGWAVLERFGLEPVADRGVFNRLGFLAGSDEERAQQVRVALAEEDTQAVWCIRGGYGTERILPLLDLPRLRRKPKLLVGFSDISALLLQMARSGGFVTIHGPVVTQLSRLPATDLRWLKSVLFGADAPRRVPLGRLRAVMPGRAEGRLVAANLSILASLVGTRFAPDLRGAVLCLEEVGEKAYRLDRLLWQMASGGLFKGVRGVVLGEMVDCTPAGDGRHSARRVVETAIGNLGVPAVSGAAFGHAKRHVALPIGVQARLDAGARTLTLLEPAIARPEP
ncbi:MAG TPA: LD-carboxypeptidase [Candidatus Baltobacteraceae bacterium]|nr:LD-carboxypeptidase [Candidatus Baltobacteraceae bacterium]